MSVTGVWVVGAVPDEKIRALLGTAGQEASLTRGTMSGDAPEGLAWWRGKAQESLFSASATSPGSWSADDDAYRLSAFIDSCYDDSEHAASLRDAVMDQFPPDAEEGLFAAVARKASSFSALAYALGPDAVMRLPGWFGDFLLDAGQVRNLLSAAEETLALTGARRREVVERIHAWMTGLGDDPDHDADELLDGPLRVLRHAISKGQGAAGHVRWY